MSFHDENRSSIHSTDERQHPQSNVEPLSVDAGQNDHTKRREIVNQQLSSLGPKYEQSQIEIASLLCEAHSKQYWRYEHESFGAYVQDVVGISVRTGQELVRVMRACQAVGLSSAEITRLGWSKLAVVARKLTPENAKSLLNQVEQKSYRELKDSCTKAGADNRQKKPLPLITLSTVIEEALRLACAHTHSVEVQPNLEFIAQKFLEVIQPPSRIPKVNHQN